MSDTEFDDDVTVDVDEALLAQIRAEAARRAGGSGVDEVSDRWPSDADEGFARIADEATQDVEPGGSARIDPRRGLRGECADH